MKVELITHTPDPEKIIAAAAKLCYSEVGVADLLDGMTDEKSASFLEMLSSIGHESPIEHVSFTFGIEGVSRALLAQITRHRIASFSVQSQRYVKLSNFVFITPPEIANDETALQIFNKSMADSLDSYNRLCDILEQKYFDMLISEGVSEKPAKTAAEKKAAEDARFVLPNACETKIVMTMNARSLLNFFRLRCCNRAQWEIRELALAMYKLCIETSPALFRNAGPSCCTGKCKEGKMTCGKVNEVGELFYGIRSNN